MKLIFVSKISKSHQRSVLKKKWTIHNKHTVCEDQPKLNSRIHAKTPQLTISFPKFLDNFFLFSLPWRRLAQWDNMVLLLDAVIIHRNQNRFIFLIVLSHSTRADFPLLELAGVVIRAVNNKTNSL